MHLLCRLLCLRADADPASQEPVEKSSTCLASKRAVSRAKKGQKHADASRGISQTSCTSARSLPSATVSNSRMRRSTWHFKDDDSTTAICGTPAGRVDADEMGALRHQSFDADHMLSSMLARELQCLVSGEVCVPVSIPRDRYSIV